MSSKRLETTLTTLQWRSRAVGRLALIGVLDGRTVDLTALEFELLHLLASRRGLVFSREMLLERVWKNDRHVTERSVDRCSALSTGWRPVATRS